MSRQTESNRDEIIAEEAARWVARLSSSDASPQDRSRFDEWMRQSPSHAAAFEEMNGLWGELAGVTRSIAPRRRGGLAIGGIAALFLAGCLGFIAHDIGLIHRYQSDFHTSVGGVQRVELDDGSVVTLNTDRAIQVRYGEVERRIKILRGEAFFDVAPDPARPFIVVGEYTKATALGTHYSVKVGDHEQVMVEEGRVALTTQEDHAVLQAGDMAERHDEGRLEVRAADIENLTSSHSGKLEFSGRPLKEVLAEVGRYRRGRIMIPDDKIGALKVRCFRYRAARSNV